MVEMIHHADLVADLDVLVEAFETSGANWRR